MVVLGACYPKTSATCRQRQRESWGEAVVGEDQGQLPRFQKILADGGHDGKVFMVSVKEDYQLDWEVVKWKQEQEFKVLPWRWIVEPVACGETEKAGGKLFKTGNFSRQGTALAAGVSDSVARKPLAKRYPEGGLPLTANWRERTLAWLMRYRSLAIDYEVLPATSEAFMYD